jgi:signal transduction histidine kinase
MNKSKRTRKFIDPEVQTAIIKRILTYWFSGIMFILMPLTLTSTLMRPDIHIVSHFFNVVTHYWPILLMMFLLLPLAVYDVNRFSNRFVGPIYRVRKELEKFEESGKLETIKFRENDYWQDLATQLNSLSSRINELESELGSKDNKVEEFSNSGA